MDAFLLVYQCMNVTVTIADVLFRKYANYQLTFIHANVIRVIKCLNLSDILSDEILAPNENDRMSGCIQ